MIILFFFKYTYAVCAEKHEQPIGEINNSEIPPRQIALVGSESIMEFTLKVVRDQLRYKYECYAHFYDVIDIPCRRQLEIIRNGALAFNSDVVYKVPDATMIMANPGAAQPFDEKNVDLLKQPLESSYPLNKARFTRVDDEMDQTLWRVKEVMELKRWVHVRVINLSDLRAGNDNKYMIMQKKFRKYEALGDSYSLFSQRREAEWCAILANNGKAPLILAWGLKNQAQREFAGTCLERIRKLPIQLMGMTKNKSGYYHPLAPGWVSSV